MTGYWMNETTGVAAKAVKAYLLEEPMTPEQIAAMRAYLRQWIAGDWHGDQRLDWLRASIDDLTTRKAIHDWIKVSIDVGIDPL